MKDRLRARGSRLCALAIVAATAACAGSNADAARDVSPADTAAASSSAPAPSAAPPTACALISAAELSRIVGTELVVDGEEAKGTNTCTFKPRDGEFGYVEVQVDWGAGDVAMNATGFLGRMEPGITSSLDGVGDRAKMVGPALWIQTGEDLVMLTIFGIDREDDAPKRIVDLIRPRMGPSSQPLDSARGSGGQARGEPQAALPKEAQDLLGGVLGMLGQASNATSNSGREAGASEPGNAASGAAARAGAVKPRPPEPTFRPATGLAPRRIPLVPGLAVVTAVHEPSRGDYEPTLTVRAITADAIVMNFSTSLPDGDDISVPRTERLADFKAARKARWWFRRGDPELFPATTTLGMSIAVVDDLRANRDAAFELYSSGDNPMLDMLSSLLGGGTDAEGEYRRGTVRRVEPHALAIPVLVNDEPVELPAIHARGTLGGEPFDFYVLDDPELPLVLRAAGRNVSQTVRLAFPVAAESPAAVLESRLKKEGRAEIYGLYFDFAKDTLRPESTAVLDQIAEVLRNNPDWRLDVEGHTDNIGGDTYNLDLSRRRAAAVERALVDRYRIAADRLTPAGFGAARPKASNDTLSGRAQNRRVELVRQ